MVHLILKARRGLVPQKRTVTRDGKNYQTTVWVKPEVKEKKIPKNITKQVKKITTGEWANPELTLGFQGTMTDKEIGQIENKFLKPNESYFDDVSSYEKNLIKEYSNRDYKDFNKLLRVGKKYNFDYDKMSKVGAVSSAYNTDDLEKIGIKVEDMINVLNDVPVKVNNVKVHRAINFGSAELTNFKEIIANAYSRGKPITFPEFVSTTLHTFDGHFTGKVIGDHNVKMEIEATGKNGVYIKDIARWAEEEEVLFNADSSFEIIDVGDTGIGGPMVIKLREI